MKITTPNFNIECTIDELKAMEQCGILAMICQPEPTPAIPFPLPELPTAGGTNETVAKTDIPDENTPEIATAEEDPTDKVKQRTEAMAEAEKKDKRHVSRGTPRNPARPVDVRTKGGEWDTFPSVHRAAIAIGCTPASLNIALKRGKTEYCGCEVRFHEEESELDKCLREIEERNRKPYEPSRPIL